MAQPQDWTVHGLDTLAVFVRGNADNSPDRFYVLLQDSTGKAATVTTDVSLTSIAWTPVSIPLSQFTGVDLHRVKVLSVGVGDRNASTPGGTGRIYIDDIRVRKAAPAIQSYAHGR